MKSHVLKSLLLVHVMVAGSSVSEYTFERCEYSVLKRFMALSSIDWP